MALRPGLVRHWPAAESRGHYAAAAVKPAAEGGQTSPAAEGGQTSPAADGVQTSPAADGVQTGGGAGRSMTSTAPVRAGGISVTEPVSRFKMAKTPPELDMREH